MKLIKQFLTDEAGVTMVEYGLLAALISIVCIAILTTVGTDLKAVFSKIATCLGGAVAGTTPAC